MKPHQQQRQQMILDMLTLSGPATARTIGEALGMTRYTVSGICQSMRNNGLLYSEDEDRSARPRKLWRVTPPVPIVRYRNVPETTGIDDDDIAWMQHYRRQAAERQQRRAVA